MAGVGAVVAPIRLGVVLACLTDCGEATVEGAEIETVVRSWYKTAPSVMNFVISVRLRCPVDIVGIHVLHLHIVEMK
jgi:hypothetical protein